MVYEHAYFWRRVREPRRPTPNGCPVHSRGKNSLPMLSSPNLQLTAPGIYIRPAEDDGSMGDHQMVDERFEYSPLLTRILPGNVRRKWEASSQIQCIGAINSKPLGKANRYYQ